MLTTITPFIAAMATIPLTEGLVLVGTVVLAGFIGWNCLKISAKAIGQLKRLVTETAKATK